jgi:shikimate dehydrogenase
MKTYGLIGYPLSHSFSPGYFFEKFQRESIRDAHYSLFPLSEISEFPNLIKEKKPAGLNVTIPYKEAVLQYADGKSQETEAIGACNVLSFDYNHGNQKIMAHNTDWIGFERSLPLNFISEQALII